MWKRIFGFLTLFMIVQLSFGYKRTYAYVFKNKLSTNETKLSPGIKHIKETYRTKKGLQSVNLLKINLTDPDTALKLAVPEPINRLNTVKSLAIQSRSPKQRVVAATNAAFFLADHYPANLIAINNQIINYGILGENYESPTQQPVAFGINKLGQPLIDYFTRKVSLEINGQTIIIDQINKKTDADKTVLYTKNKPETDESSVEIIIDGTSDSKIDISFGEQVTGTVKQVDAFDQDSPIPVNGFIISIPKKLITAHIKAGDQALLTIAIDDTWQDAEYILAAGPLLVQDGQTTLSMPTDADFVTSQHARTAIGIDKSGDVLLVTVDRNRPEHTHGTNLPDLAQYLISQGAESALNLDGGSSTTMVISDPDSLQPKLANTPKYLFAPDVSASLQAVHKIQ